MWLRLRNVGPLEFPKPTSRQADGDSRSDFQPLRGFLRLTGILLSMVAAFFLSDVVEIPIVLWVGGDQDVGTVEVTLDAVTGPKCRRSLRSRPSLPSS